MFYDVEAKGWKFRRKRIEDTKKLFEKAESDYIQNQLNNLRDSMRPKHSEEMDGGSSPK